MRSTTKHLHQPRCNQDGETQLVVCHCCRTRTHNILTRNPKHTSTQSVLDPYSSIVRKQNSVSSLLFFILLCVAICFPSFSESSFASSPLNSTVSKESLRTLPKIKILEYDETGAFIRNTLSIYPNSDLVLEDEFSETDHRLRGKKIVVECSATYPVQWSYSGDGSPDYVENSLVNENHYDNSVGKSTTLFSTSLSFRRTLQEQDTGKYTCTNVIKENVASSVYLFVAGSGKKLFAYASGVTKNKIKFSRNEPTVRIPCSVTHPNVLVSLHKFQRTFARRFLNDSSISYNPKSGFHLDLSKIRSSHADPSGIYICSAAMNNAFQFIEYELTQESPVGSSTVGDLNGSTTDGSCSFKYDCSSDTTCFMNKCRSPCSIYPVTCPRTSRCQVIDHSPSCVPIPTAISNAEREISDISSLRTEFEPQAILRSACGPTVCGRNAECIAIEYKSHCVCLEGYTGNGKISCHRMSQQLVVSRDPCANARCGLHSSCTEINGHAVCSCLPDYNGYPPYCKPEAECSSNNDCSKELFCNIRISKCQEPCLSFEHRGCGSNAICVARRHNAYCLCNEGYTGNPNSKCFPVRNEGSLPIRSPCHPSPCGQSAHCRVIKDQAPYCYCPSGLRGNPRIRCYAPSEKLTSSTTSTTTTVRTPTFRPLPSALDSSSSEEKSPSPCETHPCGPNASCRVINGVSACKCYPNHSGDPYRRGCFIGSKPRPQEESSRPTRPGEFDTPSTTEGSVENASGENHVVCRANGNCPLNLACYNYRCVNPCLGSCGRRARCKVVGHTPVCSCPELFTGDPLISCRKIISNPGNNDPCTSCGPNSNCKIINRRVHCECNPWSVGSPPKCRRVKCTSNEDCADNKACVDYKCLNPCEYSVDTGYAYRNQTACGFGATCDVVNHKVSCRCPPGFRGDPISSCYETGFPPNSFDPCERAPCGPNSQCKVVLGLVNYRRCTCNEGYYFSYYGCRKIPFDAEDNPCNYSPCGPNSLCSSAHGVAYCQCDDKSTGTPPHCYPKISTFNDRWTFVPIISE